jgi:Ni/Fe-hydrogenase subunit HybB-like protein
MTERDLEQRLITRAVAGRYDVFVKLGGLLAAVGAALFVLAVSGGHGERAWQAFHVNWLYFTGLTAGSLALNAVYKVANAKWAGVIVRFSQATVFFGVVSLLGCVLILTFGYHAIYGPMHEQLHSMSPGKQLWLSHGFMAARLLLGLFALFTVGWLLVRADLLPDMARVKASVGEARRPLYEQWTVGYDASAEGQAANAARIRRLAPLYVVLYALVATLVAFDGVMALQPHWFSNLLGGFYFMGSFLGGHTLLVLLMLYGRRQLGISDLVSPKQRHDLGKMCFGFTVFWAYLMWAQFLVIWYGNLPEETGFVFARLWGPWLTVGRWVFLGMFLIPFWGFLFVAAKKSPFVLGLFATVSLVALWLERYLLVIPSVTLVDGPVFGMAEAGPLLAFLGFFLLAYGLFARTFPMVSPRLATITLTEERKHGHGEEFFHDEKPKDFAMPAELERRDHER